MATRRGATNGTAPTNNADTLAALREELGRRDTTLDLLQERLAELELGIEAEGWTRWGDADGASEFSREGLDTLIRMARLAYLKNPLIRRAVEVAALYVWGQDLSLKATDPDVDAVVQAFWDTNKRALTGQQASRGLEVELRVTGNVFLALFGGAVDGALKVRTVPVEEIRQVVRNPEDRLEPWYYRRIWWQQPIDNATPQRIEMLYPDWRYRPTERLPDIKGVPIEWETPLYHVEVGGFNHWQFGVPEVYAALDWSRAYKDMLEDDASRSRALTRFAFALTTKGGARAVAAAKSRLGTTFGTTDFAPDTNPPGPAGATWIQGEGADLKPVNLSASSLPSDHARPLHLMVAAAVGLPETFFGNANVGNHATAKTLDRPTELQFSERRALWRDVLGDVLAWQVERAAVASGGPLSGAARLNPDGSVTWPLDLATGDPKKDVHVDLDWPDLLEQSVTERIAAIVQAATLDGHPAVGTIAPESLSRLLLGALGVDDLDDELAALFPDDGAAAADDAALPAESLAEALRELRAYIQQRQVA